jgi:hypothetical protein
VDSLERLRQGTGLYLPGYRLEKYPAVLRHCWLDSETLVSHNPSLSE